MNDFLKNISTPLSERAKSPFYGSFIVSWLIWNWRIIFVIIFTSKYNLEGQNLSDFILSHYLNSSNWCYNGLLFPLLITAIYILILPWLDFWILGYSEKIKRKKIDKKIEIGRKYKVDGDTYYDLKLNYENLKSQVLTFEKDVKEEKSISKEKENVIKKMQSELSEKDRLFEKKDAEFKTINDRFNTLSQRDKTTVFQGRWQLEFTGPDNKTGFEEFEIISNQYRIIRNNTKEQKFNIKFFEYDLELKRVRFLKYLAQRNTNEKDGTNELNIISKDIWEGYENDTISVTYRRIKEDV